MTVLEYLDEALESFVSDPADTGFQRGYLAAIKEVRRYVVEQEHGHE